MAEVVEAHVRAHFGDGAEASEAEGAAAAEQLIDAVRTYLR
jgi:DNA-binding FrmR family transcriptional regulator